MNAINSIGGRKFTVAILSMIMGTAIEVYSPNGLSATMATFLASLVTAFSVGNVVADKIAAASAASSSSSEPPPGANVKIPPGSIVLPTDAVDLETKVSTFAKETVQVLDSMMKEQAVIRETLNTQADALAATQRGVATLLQKKNS